MLDTLQNLQIGLDELSSRIHINKAFTPNVIRSL